MKNCILPQSARFNAFRIPYERCTALARKSYLCRKVGVSCPEPEWGLVSPIKPLVSALIESPNPIAELKTPSGVGGRRSRSLPTTSVPRRSSAILRSLMTVSAACFRAMELPCRLQCSRPKEPC